MNSANRLGSPLSEKVRQFEHQSDQRADDGGSSDNPPRCARPKDRERDADDESRRRGAPYRIRAFGKGDQSNDGNRRQYPPQHDRSPAIASGATFRDLRLDPRVYALVEYCDLLPHDSSPDFGASFYSEAGKANRRSIAAGMNLSLLDLA